MTISLSVRGSSVGWMMQSLLPRVCLVLGGFIDDPHKGVAIVKASVEVEQGVLRGVAGR